MTETPEESFRQSLKDFADLVEKLYPLCETPEELVSKTEDLIVVATKLAPLCKTSQELVGMARLALGNDGQLRLLMSTVIGKADAKQ